MYSVLCLCKKCRCLHAIHHNVVIIYSSMHQQLNELPAILDGVTCATSIYIGVGGWREPQSGKQKLCQNMKATKRASVGVIFSSTYHTKHLIHGQHHQLVMGNLWQKFACPSEMEHFKDHLSIHGHLTSLRNKLHQKQPG